MFWYVFEYTPHILKYSRSGSYIDIEITCLKEILVTCKIQKLTGSKLLLVNWYMAARKLCLVVDSQDKI